MRFGDKVFFDALPYKKALASNAVACQSEKRHIAN